MANAVAVFDSLPRTASADSQDQVDNNADLVHFVISVTALTASPSVVFTIQGKDPVVGTYYDLLVSAAITATGTTVLKLGPGLTPVPNASAADFLPAIWRVRAAHGNANSITYSVSAVFGE